MTLQSLRYFIAVAEYKSFTKASEHLYVSQPTISRQIADLEEEIGVALLERKGRLISLTKAGNECLKRSKEIVVKCNKFKESVRHVEETEHAFLRIGYLGDIEHNLIETPMRQLLDNFPELDLTIQKTSLSELNQFLIEDKCDVIYSVKVGVESIKELEFVSVAENHLKLFVPKSHPLSSRSQVSVAELREEKFVMFERDVTPLTVDNIVSMCVRNGFSPKVVYSARDAQTMVYAVGSGKGIAFLSERIEIEKNSNIKLLDIIDCDLDFDIVIAHKRDNRNPYIPLYVDEVKKLHQ